MNLLIVDDEIMIINVLRSQFDWQKLGISHVFTALNMRQASEILSSQPIDILICDIEMPQGSGLDLLKWVNDRKLNPVTIFLTGHANFDYARQAVNLKSLDYLLKPVKFNELELVIQRAIAQVEDRRTAAEYQQYGENWLSSRLDVANKFWLDVLTGNIQPNLDEIERAAKIRRVPFNRDHRYCIVLVSNPTEQALSMPLQQWDIKFSLNNMASELFSGLSAVVTTSSDHQFVYIVSTEQPTAARKAQLTAECDQLITSTETYLKLAIEGYIGDFIAAEKLSDHLKELEELEKNNVTHRRLIVLADVRSQPPIQYEKPDWKTWSMLLQEGHDKDLIRVAQTWLVNLAIHDRVDANVLQRFQHDFNYMIISYLAARKIPAEWVFGKQQDQEQLRLALTSVKAMTGYIADQINQAMLHTQSEDQPHNTIDRITNFVTSNLYQDLSRDAIAHHVGLNPEYLSKLFRRETGLSLLEYIQSIKINQAKQLLNETSLTVGEIASRLGYSNFAYFAQIFKKSTGQSPNVYRKIQPRSN